MSAKGFIALAALAAAFSCGAPQSPVAYVDPLIGSGGHGHVFVGAGVPFGMVQLGPVSIPQDWDWCSGYHASDSTVIGFSHTHLSGTGIGDLFDITLMPAVGEVTYARGTEDDPASGLWSYADRRREVAEPGYYRVPLTRYGITAELTATERCGMHRYTFPASDSSAVVIDLENGGCWDRTVDCGFEIIDSSTICGYRYSTGWAKVQKQYFCAVFSKPVKFLLSDDGRYMRCSFGTRRGEKVLVKVGLSPSGADAARKALEAELPGWNFDKTRLEASAAWDGELSKIKVEGADGNTLKIFYTALYHTMIAPSLFSDEGEAPSYTTYSLWDTYRAAMPLYLILHPGRRSDMINSMLAIFDSQGKLPVWHLMGNETDCMVGNPGVIAVADAIVKRIPGIDFERAYRACKASVMLDERGQDLRKKYGYIPCDLYPEACAADMEYAIADAAVARAAGVLGHKEDSLFFARRSLSWSNFFDAQTGFIRGRTSRGQWRTPFNPFFAEHRANDYCEGNAFQYTWLVPHDIKGLSDRFGGVEALAARLDSLFAAPSLLERGASPDMTGMIGQYVHGNEPSHHIAYIYTMIGQPWKTADRVRRILAEMYGSGRDGLPGNEDVGQMSAWYALSAMGFYQAEPASGRFLLGSPIFSKVQIDVGEGRTFTLEAPLTSPQNRYIQSVTLNGEPWRKPYVDFADIEAGAVIHLTMGPEPALWYEPDEFISRTGE